MRPKNFSIVFIFLLDGYYLVVSVGQRGQLSFDCRSSCGRNRRMQGVSLRGFIQMFRRVSPRLRIHVGFRVHGFDFLGLPSFTEKSFQLEF